MKFFDISRPFFHTPVYPGDPIPAQTWISHAVGKGSYNLSCLSGCVHTATHADAPLHVFSEGRSIDQLPLDPFYGECVVISACGILTEEWVDQVVMGGENRILLRGSGRGFLSKTAACRLTEKGVVLIGTDASSIGTGDDEYQAHVSLLSRGIGVLEGLDLSEVPDGEYLLCAFPIKLDGAEGAPVRAVLIQNEEILT